jgi:hypothetical protein
MNPPAVITEDHTMIRTCGARIASSAYTDDLTARAGAGKARLLLPYPSRMNQPSVAASIKEQLGQI